MDIFEGVKRLLMLVAVIAGFVTAYVLVGNPFVRADVFASFAGLGALIALVVWFPIRYVLKGFSPAK